MWSSCPSEDMNEMQCSECTLPSKSILVRVTLLIYTMLELNSIAFIKTGHSSKLVPESESYVTTDGQPASLSWNKAPIWGLRPGLYYLCDSYGLVLVGRLL
jgi:hypothetical protein